MTETVKVPLFCESKNKVVSGEGDGKVLRPAIGGGFMVEGHDEVEYTRLERGEDCVDCMADCMVGVDEEFPKSRFALATERTRAVELESRGPVCLQIWSPGVGKRPNLDDKGARVIPMSIVADERARQRRGEFRSWNEFENFIVLATPYNQFPRVHCEMKLLKSQRYIIHTRGTLIPPNRIPIVWFDSPFRAWWTGRFQELPVGKG